MKRIRTEYFRLYMQRYRQTPQWKEYWAKRRKESEVYKKNRLAYKNRKKNGI